jgi:hypothetical protein
LTREIGKIKVTGINSEDVLVISDAIRNLFAPYVVQSELKQSDHGGYHAFLTIYKLSKEENSQ